MGGERRGGGWWKTCGGGEGFSQRWVVGGSSTYHDVGVFKDLHHELAAEVNGQQNLFVQLDVHPHPIVLCGCGSVEECGCEGVGVRVWGV